ncbi:MAG: universal stress protein [Geobacter sp.]|nr:universal stress protein [Geobacter sp.]
MFKHLLVPTDGSPLSAEAVTRAVSFAKEAEARTTFFCAVQPAPKMYYGVGAIFDTHAFSAFREKMLDTATDILAAAIKVAEEAGVDCSTVSLMSEEPYEAIITAATQGGCDLIFMASHGRRGVSGLLLGSETQKVLTHSTVPVLVYRSDKD